MKKVNAGTLYALTLSYGHDMIKYKKKVFAVHIVDTFILLYTLINFDFSKYKNANVFIKIGLGNQVTCNKNCEVSD